MSKSSFRFTSWLGAIGVTLVLSACGGSGSGGGPASPSPIPPSPTPVPDESPATPLTTSNGLELFGQSEAQTNASVGFAIRSSSGNGLNNIIWEQISGPETVTFLASHTQAIGFDVATAGDYQLRVTANEVNGSQRTLEFTFQVSESDTATANIRLDHSATERGRASLKVDTSETLDISSIEWEQIAGPLAQNVTIDEDSPSYVFFDAPAVTRDSLIVYQATVTFSDQSTATDTAFVMVKDDAINDEAYFPNSNLIVSADMFAYKQDSPYAGALEGCVYTNQLASTCRFSQLPLIGQVEENPTVDDILDRTLVSHAWMGERFELYLRNSATGPDMLQLLRATTAIVISYDVRPSFYWTATGAIYLDGRNFWQTPQERDTLNDRPDFRSDFGSDLQFVIPWRYVRNNDYYPAGRYPAAERLTRTFDDLEASISWLMYHELGHANDFFPPSRWPNISLNDDPLSHFRANGATSDGIPLNYPLSSQQMKDLAQVSFAGETASTQQRGYLGTDVEQFFAPDVAPSYYSYLNEREDFATLFERFMMIYRLGASADVGIIDTVNNDDLIVTWGQRNRINDPTLHTRVRFAVSTVLPNLDVTSIQVQLPDPELLDPTKSWFDNVVLSGGQLESVNLSVPLQLEREFKHESLHGPDLWMPMPQNN